MCIRDSTHTHTHARTHARVRTDTQTYTHKHTHTHTHTHTQTQTHTHTPVSNQLCMPHRDRDTERDTERGQGCQQSIFASVGFAAQCSGKRMLLLQEVQHRHTSLASTHVPPVDSWLVTSTIPVAASSSQIHSAGLALCAPASPTFPLPLPSSSSNFYQY